MTIRPYRSHLTEMTDDELLLADALALVGWFWRDAFRQEEYSFHMNLPYSHGIADHCLEGVLTNLCNRGWFALVESDERGKGQRYRLTPKGGALWEIERKPIWRLYCVAGLGEGDDGKAFCCVTSYDKDVGDQYVKYVTVVDELGNCFHLLPGHQCLWVNDPEAGIPYWQETDSAWSCRFEIARTDDHLCCNWDELDQRRTWWGTLEELQKFLPQPAAEGYSPEDGRITLA